MGAMQQVVRMRVGGAAGRCWYCSEVQEGARRLVRDLPRGYWGKQEHRVGFLEALGRMHGVGRREEWARVRNEDVVQAGGRGLLKRHGYSLRRVLQESYPEQEWRAETCRPRRQRNAWSRQATRDFLLRLADQLGVSHPHGWQEVSSSRLQAAGASGLLARHNGSVTRLLRAAFPEHAESFREEARRKLPKGHWESRQRRRAFLEAFAAAQGIGCVQEWRRVSAVQLLEVRGAASLLARFASHPLAAVSPLWAAVADAYGAEVARGELHAFHVCASLPAAYWACDAHVAAFVRHVEAVLALQPGDWSRVSRKQVAELGGAGLLAQMPLQAALRIAHPTLPLVPPRPLKKAAQRSLLLAATHIFA